VQAAVSEVATAQQQLDREIATRKELEATIERLSQHLKAEERRSYEYDMNRREWEEQTKSLLSRIREECNTVFEKRPVVSPRMNTTTAAGVATMAAPTPKSIFTSETDRDSPILLGLGDNGTTSSTTQRFSPTLTSPTWTCTTGQYESGPNSPLSEDFEKILDETEALIDSLVESGA